MAEEEEAFDPNKPPGDCTPEEHRTLQQNVKTHCKGTAGLGCDPDKYPKMECSEIKKRFQNQHKCFFARREINVRCFRGGNEGHEQAEDDAGRAAAKCAKRWYDQCRDLGPVLK